MAFDINSIENNVQSTFQPRIFQRNAYSATSSTEDSFQPLNSFADEDQAIISAEAKLQYELDKFNSGGDNAVNLALTGVMSKFTVDAEVNVINAKKNMTDEILKMGE